MFSLVFRRYVRILRNEPSAKGPAQRALRNEPCAMTTRRNDDMAQQPAPRNGVPTRVGAAILIQRRKTLIM